MTRVIQDLELLRRYATEGSEEAFRRLFQHYWPLVYSLAQQELRDPFLAEEAGQLTFILLSRKAEALHRERHPTIGGWLINTTRLVCRNLHRQQSRRRSHEAQILSQSENGLLEHASALNPHVLDALESLQSTERTLLLLRFFEEQEFTEIGQQLGISEDAARMRVNRALKRVRTFLQKRGVSTLTISLLLSRKSFSVHTCPLSYQQLSPGSKGVIHLMNNKTRNLVIAALGTVTCASAVFLMELRATAHSRMDVPNVSSFASAQVETAPPVLSSPTANTIPTGSILVKARLLEQVEGENRKYKERVLQAPLIATNDGTKGTVYLESAPPSKEKWKLEVVPHLNANKTIGLDLVWENQSGDEETDRRTVVKAKKQLKPNEAARITLVEGKQVKIILEITATAN